MFSVIGSIISPNPLAIQQFCTAFAFDTGKLGGISANLRETPEVEYLPENHLMVQIVSTFPGGCQQDMAEYILRAKTQMPDYVQYFLDFPEKTTIDRGFVYLIEAVDSGRYKIGFSYKPKQRLAQLQKNQPPYPLRLVWTAETSQMGASEDWLKKAFRPYQKHNEWFQLPQQALDIFNALEFV